MIYNFIICEDNKWFNNEYQEVVKNVSKTMNLNFNLHVFYGFNDDLKELIYSDMENKIYILDLVMRGTDGINIADMIRKVDLASFIIFITSYHDEFEDQISDGEFLFLKYIDKSDNFQEILFSTLKTNIEKKINIETIKIEIKNKFFQFNPFSITHFFMDGRKVIIKGINDTKIEVPTTLNDLQNIFPNYFLKSKNSCVVNIKRISNIDKKEKIIYFNDGTNIDLVSKKYLKIILEKLK